MLNFRIHNKNDPIPQIVAYDQNDPDQQEKHISEVIEIQTHSSNIKLDSNIRDYVREITNYIITTDHATGNLKSDIFRCQIKLLYQRLNNEEKII